MIVDCHTHIDFTSGDAAKSEHLAAAETVDACIVLADMNVPFEQANKDLSDYVGKYKRKMIGFAVIFPGEEKIDPDLSVYIKDKLGLKGAVFYCSASGIHPAHSNAKRFYESAQENNLPVFFHNAGLAQKTDAILDYAQPYLLDEIARDFPELKIIIGNMGIPFVEQTLLMLAKHKNVYADLTIQPKNVWETYNTVVAAYEHGVMDKLLFGSGFPSSTAGQCMEALLGFNMLLADTNLPTVPRGSIRNIIERNTLELLGIKHQFEQPQEQNIKTTRPKEEITTTQEGNDNKDD